MKYRNLILNLLFFGFGMGASLPGVLAPFWTKTFHWGPEMMGGLYSLQFVFCLVGVLVSGRWSDSHGKVPLLQGGSGAMVLGLVSWGIGALVPPETGFLFVVGGIVLLGLGAGTLAVTGNALCADFNQPHPAQALGFLNFSYAAGSISGPGLVLLSGGSALALPPLLTAVLPLGCLFLAANPAFREEPRARQEKLLGSKGLWSQPFLWGAGLAAMLYAGVEGGMGSWLPLYWTSTGLDNPASSALWFWVFLTIGRLLYARYASHFAFDRFLLGTSAVLVAASLIWLFLGPGPWLLVPVALMGLGCAGIFPALMSAIAVRTPDATGAAGSVLMLLSEVGAILWPSVTGMGLGHFGPVWLPLVLVTASGGIGVLAFGWLLRRK